MNVIYDIQTQKQPKDFIFIIVGICMIVAFVLFLTRIIFHFKDNIHMDKVELVLSFFAVFILPIMSVIFISMDVNTIRDFKVYCNMLESNDCLVATGKPTIVNEYEINVFSEELIIFEIEGKEFDTMNLYRTENGLSEEQIETLKNADSVTVKYVKSKDVNWIVYIGTE